MLDSGLQQGRMFACMQALQGQTMAEAMAVKAAHGQALTEEQVRRVAAELLVGLAEAAEAGLCHSNITPHNVLLTPGGVTLLGLGLAGWEPEMISNASYKLPVNMMPQYMSPEQATGRLVDARSDLFAVGVLMYHAVGPPPYHSPNPHTLQL